MIILMAVVALSALAVLFWWVGVHVGTDPTDTHRRRVAVRVRDER